MSRFVAALIAASGALSVVVAPAATADPDPVSPSARSIIDGLEADGYDVQINWMHGPRSESLSRCSVTDIHNPNRSGEPPTTFTTVYIDVSCPEHNSGDVGLFWGVGGFF